MAKQECNHKLHDDCNSALLLRT